MSYQPPLSFNSSPKIVKWILLLVGSLTLLSTQVTKFFGIISPYKLFGLSTWGLKHGMIWQLLTFAFTPQPGETLGFGLLLSLFFNLYILFFVSNSLIAIHGLRHFYKLFFGGIATTALCVTAALFLFGTPFPYCSPSTLTFLLLTAWMFIDPERQILLFMIIPLKIKWLALIFFGGQIIIEFAGGHFIHFIGLLTPCLFAWGYALLSWEIMSPFSFLHPFEQKILRLKKRQKKHYDLAPATAKIYDIRTGERVMDDDTFMDECLSKISNHGENALNWREKWRMKRISRRRAKRNRSKR